MEWIHQYSPIVISSATVYLFVIFAIRLFGRKEFAQLSITDLVFVLLISNAVQNAMVGPDNTLTGGLVAATTLFIVNYAFKYLMYKFPTFHKFFSGEPVMLIYKGHVKEDNLRKVQISINELLEAVHEHGSASIKDVDLAILEPDGNISVMTHDFQKRSNKPRKRRKKVNTN